MYVLLLFRTNTVIANSLSQSRYICTIYWSWWYLLCLFCAFVALWACESAQQHASVINTRSIIQTVHPMQNTHVHRAATLWARHHRAAMTNKLHLLPSLSIYFCSVVVTAHLILLLAMIYIREHKGLHAGTHKLSTRQRTWRSDKQHLTTHGLQSLRYI